MDLQVSRLRNFSALDLTNVVLSAPVLGTGWFSNGDEAQAGWADYPVDENFESATLHLAVEPSATSGFYRVETLPVDAIPPGPEVHFSGSTASVDVGAIQELLTEQSISVTVQVALPSDPLTDGSGNDRAEVLWEFGGGKGISLVLMGDQIVFSGASSISTDDWVNLSSTLNPEDFGNLAAIRLSLEHKASSTIFQLSHAVQNGSTSASVPEIRQFTGYIGTAKGGFGNYYAGNLNGVGGTAYGILATLPGGIEDISAWSSGNITYELAAYVAPVF